MVESFGSALARLRKEHRPTLTLRALSEVVHYSHVYLWQIEHDLKAVTAEVAARCDRAVEAGGELIAVAERAMAAQATMLRRPGGEARTNPAGEPDRRADPAPNRHPSRDPIWNGRRSTCDTVLDELRRARERFARLYGSNGGVAVRPRLLEYIRNDAEPSLDSSPERCRAIGALIALAGLCAHDAEDHASTARHGTRAMELALVSDDAEFIAYVTALIARQEVERGLAAEALERTERLLRRLPDSVTRVLRAELHQARAEAYAVLGDHERSADESVRAHSVHSRDGGSEAPPELIDAAPGALESRYADSLRRLGEPEKAEPYAWAAVILGRHAPRRGRVERLLVLADILRALEEPVAAAAKAREALDLAEEMESMRLHRRLTELAAELAPYRAHPGVREFCGRVNGLVAITP